MKITKAAVVRETLYSVVLLAALIFFQTFLNYLVTNRFTLAVFAIYVGIRFAIFAARALRHAG